MMSPHRLSFCYRATGDGKERLGKISPHNMALELTAEGPSPSNQGQHQMRWGLNTTARQLSLTLYASRVGGPLRSTSSTGESGLNGSAGSGNGDRDKGLRRGRFQTTTLVQELMTEGCIGWCLLQSGGHLHGAQPKNPEPAEEIACYRKGWS
jgi:hypothetical protein